MASEVNLANCRRRMNNLLMPLCVCLGADFAPAANSLGAPLGLSLSLGGNSLSLHNRSQWRTSQKAHETGAKWRQSVRNENIALSARFVSLPLYLVNEPARKTVLLR